MRKYIYRFFCALSLVVAMLSCDTIHEFPNDTPTDPTLVNVSAVLTVLVPDLSYDLDITDSDSSEFKDMKLIVEVFKYDNTSSVVLRKEIAVTDENLSDCEYRVDLELNATRYRIVAWLSYVDQESGEDRYYTTVDGLRSIYNVVPLEGDTDLRDCFSGYNDIDLTSYVDQWAVNVDIPIILERPVAKYYLVANDITKYLVNTPSASLTDLEKYSVEVIYEGFTPYGFDGYTGDLNDSAVGLYFESAVRVISNSEAIIAMEYPLAKYASDDGSAGTTLTATIRIYDEDGDMVNEQGGFEMALSRGELSVFESDFFTRSVSSGITIDQNFDGQYNIVIGDDGSTTTYDENGNELTF